jgi:hypothetical protein
MLQDNLLPGAHFWMLQNHAYLTSTLLHATGIYCVFGVARNLERIPGYYNNLQRSRNLLH